MKQRNYYKYALLSIMAVFQCTIMYQGIPATLDALAESRFKGMTINKSKCLAKYAELTEGLQEVLK